LADCDRQTAESLMRVARDQACRDDEKILAHRLRSS
jgi:hypothetical protein